MNHILKRVTDDNNLYAYTNWTDGYYILKQTCSACPEQYDMLDPDGNTVGYFRLRHGNFTVEYPDCGGKLTLQVRPLGDGIFEDCEREYWLTLGYLSIIKEVTKEGYTKEIQNEEN